MRFIPTRIHGILDYVMGSVLIVVPMLFVFHRGAESALPITLGFVLIIYSSLTDYEMGAMGFTPMRVHLVLDVISGLLLIASPWLFGFASHLWMPHVVLGALMVGAALVTRTIPEEIVGSGFGV